MLLSSPLLDDFEPTATKLWSTAFETGLKKLADLGRNLKDIRIDPKLHRQFVIACHKGYGWAQDRAFTEIVRLNDSAAAFRAEIQSFRRSTGDPRRMDLENALKVIENRILVLRRTCDAIAFTMFGGKHWVARRFVRNTRLRPVDVKGAQTALKKAHWLNTDRLTFALATDLTTFIHVGDLIQIDFRSAPAQWRLVELKEGKINELLRELLDAYDPQRPDTKEELLRSASNITKHAPKQLDRMLRQDEDITRVMAAAKETTNMGVDLETRQKILLTRKEVQLDSYLPTVSNLIERAKARGFGVETVDTCLYLAAVATTRAFKRIPDEARHALYHHVFPDAGCAFLGSSATEAKQEVSLVAKLTPVVDLAEASFRVNSSPPLFLAPLRKEDVADLAFGRVCVLAHFDIFRFAFLAEQFGLEMGFCDRKTSEEMKRDCVLIKGRALYLRDRSGEWDMILGGGIFSKILHDYLRPAEVLRAQASFDFDMDSLASIDHHQHCGPSAH